MKLQQIIENLIKELNIISYRYEHDISTFKPMYTNAVIISEMVCLSEKLSNMSINYVIGDNYEIILKSKILRE